jgi:osmotically-inducible protein OsmY
MRLAVTVCLFLMLVGVGFLISRQGWSATAAQAHEVAAAVRRTTTVVRETSADAATTAKVKAALALSKRASAFDVGVDTKDTITSLTGTVPSFADREHIEQIAADTSGVRELRNLLLIDSGVPTDEDRRHLSQRIEELERQVAIAEALQESGKMAGAKVEVRVAGGVVTLDGTVGSEVQKVDADQIAKLFVGVQEVKNRLKVGGNF